MKTKTVSLKKRPFSPANNPEERSRFLDTNPETSLNQLSNDAALMSEMIKYKAERTKNAKKQRFLFQTIGLCISLLMVIAAFEWKFYDDPKTVLAIGEHDRNDEILDVPVTEQPPPPAPIIQQPQIVEVANEEEIVEEIKFTLDIEANEETKIEFPVAIEMIGEPPAEEKPEEIFTIVENQPEPVGGYTAFYGFVSERLKYPSAASRSNIEGKVFVQFVVEKDGSLTDVQVVKGIGFGCDEEAVRVINTAPNWAPGKQRGKPVRVRMILPIHFKLVQRF